MESFNKRQKEMRRLERQRDKAARRLQRKQDRAAGNVDAPPENDKTTIAGDPRQAEPAADE
jgi:hypothetical protein